MDPQFTISFSGGPFHGYCQRDPRPRSPAIHHIVRTLLSSSHALGPKAVGAIHMSGDDRTAASKATQPMLDF